MAVNTWTFTPFPTFSPTLIPNTAFYNATSPFSNLTYQITLSYPFEWGPNISNISSSTTSEALTIYIPDGNAFSLTAHEFLKRRKPVDPAQPDTLIVSIGYPLANSVYDFPQRSIDFGAPIPPDPFIEEGPEIFMDFITGVLRPWVRENVFPGVHFTRDALYGHSSGGLFVAWAMAYHLDLFDTFISASPSLTLRNASILEDIKTQLGDGIDIPGALPLKTELNDTNANIITTGNTGLICTIGGEDEGRKPAAFIAYGGYEEYPTRRRRETEEQFQTKKALLQRSRLGRLSHDLYDRLVASGRMRDVVVKEYPGLDHASVGACALADGLVYFMDW